ncbi:DUF6480 family protein, partial [Streptomyces sp. NPDC093595]|uniref:DUF6480 family protein n=1 Tax=Streptomyces sp. NPDC093595 TaxID=3366045 RepID=UPI0038209925
MTDPLVPPGETPPVEGSTSEAHEERADGGMWEHPAVWVWLILFGSVVVAGFFLSNARNLWIGLGWGASRDAEGVPSRVIDSRSP